VILLVLESSPHILDIPDGVCPEIQIADNKNFKGILKLKRKNCSNTCWHFMV
jgi:hypothetical protein